MSDFVKLKALAKNTVGSTSDFLLHQMSVLLELYSQLDSKIDELERQIEDCVHGIDPPILSIPGIGALSAAVILSEYGDFGKFKKTPLKCSPLRAWSRDISSPASPNPPATW